jgi:transcriptional regulator with XRE-family HTH domain
LPRYGRKRRVPGLRREEVALRAGISVEWYTRLERGVARGVSEEVLDAIGSALQLDEAERAHLADLVRTANAERPPRRSAAPQRVRPSVARIVDVLGLFPACVTNGPLDVLYANDLAVALFSDVFRDPVRPANFARFVFLEPASEDVLPRLGEGCQ